MLSPSRCLNTLKTLFTKPRAGCFARLESPIPPGWKAFCWNTAPKSPERPCDTRSRDSRRRRERRCWKRQRRDRESERARERETRCQLCLLVPLSPCPLVSSYPCPLVSRSPALPLSFSLSLCLSVCYSSLAKRTSAGGLKIALFNKPSTHHRRK